MKKFLGIIFALLAFTNSVSAMIFSQPVEIGKIGFPVQAPYHGFIVDGATSNTGTPYNETEFTYNDAPLQTYVKGVATFGDDTDALFCEYDFNSNDFSTSLKFGGRDNYVLNRTGTFKDILKIDSDLGLTFYVIYHEYCGSHLNIIGKQKSGKWVNYIDSKKISDMHFSGKDGYKEDGGVIYEKPICNDDTIIIPYHRWYWKGISETEGEIRLKWDNAAQWFGIEKIIY
jgi:hypothetical protein